MTQQLRTYRDAVAVVTGGASGLGAALAEQLVRYGAVVIIADRQQELAQQQADQLCQRGGRATAVGLDVRDAAAFDALIQQVINEHGRLDYLFNNAGVAHSGEASLYSLGDWHDVFAVNLAGIANGVQAAYPRMIAQGFGHIVNAASIAGLIPSPGLVSYAATKHAVVGLSSSLRCEAAAYNVRVSVVCPGFLRTPILQGGAFGRMVQPIPTPLADRLWKKLRPAEASACAAHTLRCVRRNRAIIVYPLRWRLLWWLNRLSPSLGRFACRKAYESYRRQLEAALEQQRTKTADPTAPDTVESAAQ